MKNKTFKILMFSFIMNTFHVNAIHAQSLTVISATEPDENNELYENSIDAYKVNEFWGIWSVPIGRAIASSVLPSRGDVTYSIENISDLNLNTAWIEGEKDYGIGVSIQFEFHYGDNEKYGSAYQFQGICVVFNGYCKSEKTWKENSRVKKLKVYIDNTPICYVNLIDTWRFQTFDISRYFVNSTQRENQEGKYKIKEGDVLKFEICEVYKGSKYKDTAISEFLAKGAGN